MSANTPVAVVPWSRLVAALEHHHIAAGLGHDAALAEARREAAWLVLTARATPAGTVMATLDRLDDAVRALAAERDALRDDSLRHAEMMQRARIIFAAQAEEIVALRDRIARAVADLDAAPDPADPEKPSRREAKAMAEANLRAWAVLCEGRDPPSRRRAGDAP